MRKITPNVLVLRTAGTNCDFETDFAFQQEKANVEKVHINRIIEKPSLLKKYQIMVFPGGFSYGDYISAGKITANQILYKIRDAVEQFIKEKKLIIGICNGFQILVKTGLLPNFDGQMEQTTTLMDNDNGTFMCQWEKLRVNSNTIFTKNMPSEIELPIAHAEGKFYANDLILKRLENNNRVVFRYVNNPNGSLNDIAGIVDETGQILGMMPHPERFVMKEQYYNKKKDVSTYGQFIFKNAVNYFAN